jgi:hypothetical protein
MLKRKRVMGGPSTSSSLCPLSNPMDFDPVIYEAVFGKEDEPLTDLEEDEQSSNISNKIQNRR